MSIARGATCGLVVMASVCMLSPIALGDAAVHTQDGVSFVSGGVGNERQTIEALGGRFNLKLTMALNDGHFVSGAQVRIQGPQDRVVLDTVADGPLLYAELQPGTYAVTCSLNGKALKQTAHVSGKGQQQLTFTWAPQ